MQDKEFIDELKTQLDNVQLSLYAEHNSYEEMLKALAELLNQLITTNFSRLISILYRLDISEKKLQEALRKAGSTTAGEIIAKMIVERQLQKLEARQKYRANNDNIANEDRW
jgi:hypothetical protein